MPIGITRRDSRVPRSGSDEAEGIGDAIRVHLTAGHKLTVGFVADGIGTAGADDAVAVCFDLSQDLRIRVIKESSAVDNYGVSGS